MWHPVDNSERDLLYEGKSENYTGMERLSTVRAGRHNHTGINCSLYPHPCSYYGFSLQEFQTGGCAAWGEALPLERI